MSNELSLKDALDLVRNQVSAMAFDGADGDSLVIFPEYTEEHDFGWVIFWGSRLYNETMDAKYAVGGNAPYIVNKVTGEIVSTGTALPIESYVQKYLKSQTAFR